MTASIRKFLCSSLLIIIFVYSVLVSLPVLFTILILKYLDPNCTDSFKAAIDKVNVRLEEAKEKVGAK